MSRRARRQDEQRQAARARHPTAWWAPDTDEIRRRAAERLPSTDRPTVQAPRGAVRTLLGVYRFRAEVWRYEGDAAWHFVTVPADISDEIEGRTAGGPRRGFGSVRVQVSIGSSTWAPSVFPDTKRQAYLLPVKAAVRRAEGLSAGDRAPVILELLDG